MHNLGDDKELDRLSREAAGRYTPPGQPNWEALSDELDKAMPVEEKKRRVIFWWLLPVLLAGGATAYWLTRTNEPATAPAPAKENTVATVAPVSGEKAKTPRPTGSTVEAKGDKTISAAMLPSKNNPAGDRVAYLTMQPHKQKEDILPAANTRSTLNNKAANDHPAGPPSNDQAGTKETVAVAGSAADKKVLTIVRTKEADQLTNPVQAGPTAAPVKENTTETITIPEIPAAPKKDDLKPRGKGLSFGVLAGVDESTVKFAYGSNVGYNLGVAVGYHFSDRLSIHTGVVYTQKNYKVAGADFTAPKGSWASYYKLENVGGYCRMLEIPLAARYTISQGNKNSVFLSAGLSSYFMTKENYDYSYYASNGALAMRNMDYNSTDTHIMSILHLSAGFENRVSKNLSLLIEPYAKIPLGGIGLGKINLNSFGLNFSVQYRQPAKK